MTTLSLEALGARVEIRVHGSRPDELAETIERAWSRCLRTRDAETAPADILLEAGVGSEPAPGVVTGDDVDDVMGGLSQRITEDAVTHQAGRLLMLHACAVAHPDTGDAVVLVGPSGMGKTTLAASLGRRWAYLSDETAAIDDDGRVLAYPKPLSVVRVGQLKAQRSPDELGLKPAIEAARPRAVLLLDRQTSGEHIGLHDLPMVDAVCLLAEHTSFLGRLPAPLHRLAELVTAAGGARRVTYTEADQLVPVVRAAVGEAL